MLEWERDRDADERLSFDDSDRFEEDSLCSWCSEPESLCNNWRGWKKQTGTNSAPSYPTSSLRRNEDGSLLSLTELCARVVAAHTPFELVEHSWQPVPEPLQLRIAFWSFPDNEEDIRLYSCLANGSPDEFQKGEQLYRLRAVKEPLQIGFHLSAAVIPPLTLSQNKTTVYNVAVTFDRRHITSCNCTCTSRGATMASWCSHIVAVCLHRIHQASSVCLRAPVSESLSRLQRDQLQKFAQYLISELPQQILPTAQRLLDELLSTQPSAINTLRGAPDPTAGASASEQTSWCLDESTLHENIRKILIKFCVPSPTVFSDVNYLSTTAPPAAAEWSSLLRPLRGREPEGMWNLLSIVREMFKRHDRNAVPMLEVITEECMACEQIMVWWFNTKVALHSGSNPQNGKHGGLSSQSHASQHACASLCDEVVVLWRLAALNPGLADQERVVLAQQFRDWHVKVIDKVTKSKGLTVAPPSTASGGNNVAGLGVMQGSPGHVPIGGAGSGHMSRRASQTFRAEVEVFSGFKPAIEATRLDWHEYPIPGITYHPGHRFYHCPFTCFRHVDSTAVGKMEVHASAAVLQNDLPHQQQQPSHHALRPRSVDFSTINGQVAAAAAAAVSNQRDGNRSSVSSEGFCENDENVEAAEADALGSRKLGISRQDSVELEEDWERTAGGKASDDSQNTDKEKSSPEDIDLDSDWSSAPEAAAAAAITTGGAGSGAALSSGVPTETNSSAGPSQASKPGETGVLAGLKPLDYPLEILLARAEGLHAHGHSAEACRLGVQLANELLASPPDLMVEFPPMMIKGKKKKTNPACHAISCLASATLAKCAFLCTVLSENPEHFHLGFKVGLFGLELARPPATTKALEVKLAYQESELVTLLKRIPLGPAEMAIIRDKAAQLRDGRLRTRGEALLPLSLATFIFEALVMAGLPGNDLDMAFFGVGVPCRSPFYGTLRYPSDEVLGFEAAVAALGLKANVSEAEHPLLCEGTRRQRGDLAIMLLMHYKDDPDKLAKIMDKLLDKEVHQMYKAPLLSTYYTSAGSAHSHAHVASSSLRPEDNRGENNTPLTYPPPYGDLRREANQSSGGQDLENNVAAMSLDPAGAEAPSAVYPNATSTPSRVAGAVCTKTTKRRMGLPDRSSPSWDDEDTTWEEPANVAAANCGASKTGNRVSGIRSLRHAGPGSDSGSSASGKSSGSDSFRTGPSATVGSGNGQPGTALQMGRPSQGPLLPSGMTRHHVMLSGGENVLGPRSGAMNNSKINRYKKRVCPSIPNQPSEASAHFMFELAKTVLNKAGGNSSTSLFTQPSSSSNPRGGPHRALHMCAFQIGLYALGLHNCVSPNWLSRTYSSHVSWITGQAMEIGAQAINFLIGTWEGHLTPPEVASIADRASRGHESSMERAAAELALSCLPHAHALNPNEIQRAIMQCKEQSDEMLERACMAVESAAKGGGVYPEVLFDVSRKWYELYEQHSTPHRHRNSRHHASASSSNSSNSYATYHPSEPYAMDIVHVSQAPPNAAPAQGPPPQAGPPPGIGVTVPYPMASIMPFPLYSFLPGGAPPPGPGCQPSNAGPLSMPMYLSASAGQGPTPYSFAPPLPGLQYFSSLPMPLSNNANTNNAPPPPPSAALLPMSHSQQQPPRGPPLLPTTGPPMSVPVSLPLVHVPIPGALFAQAQPTIPSQPGMRSSPTGGNGTGGSVSAAQLRYLLAAYRVGIVALETLGRRAHDDRPQAKYSRNPPYGVDVKWLLSVAKKLGTDYLQQFCISTVNSVVSPFILHEIAVETAHYLTCTAPAGPFVQHLRSRMLTPLVQKCQQMYVQCVHHKMYHIMAAEYDDFVSILQSSRAAFHLTPTGPMQFNDLVQSLQRSKSCSKELWAKIAAALRQPMV